MERINMAIGANRITMSAVAAAGLIAAAPAGAQSAPFADADATHPVVVVVKVPKPWYAPRSVVVGKMRDTIAQYANLPGLAFKAFSFERESGDYGGVYYWRDRASAKAWFNAAWFERVRKERGSEAKVTFFDALVSIDNSPGGTAANPDSASIVTIVEIPIPSGVSRERLSAAFGAAVPTYQKAVGLMRKHFVVSDNSTFGGVYVWKDEGSAKAWFDTAWFERTRKTYGQDAKIEWFDTPILLPTQSAGNKVARGAMIVAAP